MMFTIHLASASENTTPAGQYASPKTALVKATGITYYMVTFNGSQVDRPQQQSRRYGVQYSLQLAQLPESVRTMPDPPDIIYINATRGERFGQLMAKPRVAIVGTRRVTPYGKQITMRLTAELAAQGVVIVSGLALGVDAIAHRAVLEAGGDTMAVLPSPVDYICPASHGRLAQEILNSGGVLLSEYPSGQQPYKVNFIERNRIVTALSDVLLITEAAENSGTMHTARFALEQGTDVAVVPGNVTSPTSEGTNNLLKQGATPVTSSRDILTLLNIPLDPPTGRHSARPEGGNQQEQLIIDLIGQGITDGSAILHGSQLSVEHFNHHLTMLEITAKIRPLGNNHWALR